MITIEENIRQTLSYVRGRIKEKDLASYDEILFVSKVWERYLQDGLRMH